MNSYDNPILKRLDIRFFDNALCAQSDPDSFFAERGARYQHVNQAKAICFSCPNRKECLDYALDIDDRWAIMGGLTPKGRRHLRKKHRQKVNMGIAQGLTAEEIANENDLSVEYVKKMLSGVK